MQLFRKIFYPLAKKNILGGAFERCGFVFLPKKWKNFTNQAYICQV